eukprot:CAMPEP_0113408558 /NCGR_PEP_ID=MMETSP0013_2-20120614/20675_1 /TAXON_ID=2843 ORGANISM="Skeletonema costatum, Strain 1716" /NCGR_SAMPLE_ID=MMETSP0013_2 /ASSEMBLY_ACC=CAM_ASM_000158 /LENGTH=57 /DNA_ID=CAMNT_0000294611 /DNA_START=42 /DNA_END=215 /DNA_ORIENTATION=- /assembly_acc=CAM_ASM_000158
MNDRAKANNPIMENFERKLTSGEQERSATITLGMIISIFLEPVVIGMSSMKDIIATS